VADALDLAHKYCNPSRQEYQTLGFIPNEDRYRFEGRLANKSPQQIEDEIRINHEARERYCFKKLLELDTWPILFVCGADHTEPFCALFQVDGIVVHVLFTKWVPD